MLELRKNAKAILHRVSRGERLVLSHRGKPVARLAPVSEEAKGVAPADPFLTIAQRASPSPKGATNHRDIDRILYGGR